jgi:hypothetical protein
MNEPEWVYVEAIGRNPGEEKQHSHLYGVNSKMEYLPMCIYGWNRSDGDAFSIFRGHTGGRGLCKICEKRARAGLPPVESKDAHHKTKWL